MHNQPVIAFDLSGISLIIVDAMPVKGQRGIAKQECAVELYPFAGFLIRRGLRDLRLRGVLAVNQFLIFGQGKQTALFDVVPKRDKTQRAGPTLFARHRLDRAGPLSLDPCKKRAMECQFARRPHAPGQAQIGNETACGRVPVAPQLFGWLRIPEIDLVIEGRHRIAGLQVRGLAERGLQGAGARNVKRVGDGLGTAVNIVHDQSLSAMDKGLQMPQLTGLDHLVLTVADMDRTIAFYRDVLGMAAEAFHTADGSTRWALKFGVQKINLHPAAAPFAPMAAVPTAGSADLCFLTATPLDAWQTHLTVCDVPIEEGPIARTGATGPIMSIYLRDPDGNLIELAVLV